MGGRALASTMNRGRESAVHVTLGMVSRRLPDHVLATRLLVLAVAVSMLPGILVLLGDGWPALGHLLGFDQEEFYSPIGCWPDLHGRSRAILDITNAAYLWPSLVIVALGLPGNADWRGLAATGVAALAAATLLFLVPTLATVWTLALAEGHGPAGDWGTHLGNHGPWRRVCHLRILLSEAFALPLGAGVLALVSRLARRTSIGLAALTASVASYLGLVLSHAWLID